MKTAIGLPIIPRDKVALIFAQVGLVNGILNAELYAIMLIVIASTTPLPPFTLQ